jgi:8-oxo-dGTP pyrophosphatase MutT (NUDIX family)
MDWLLAHIEACDTARLPGDRVPFRLGAAQVGWVKRDLAATLGEFGLTHDADGVSLADPAALPGLARTLSERGMLRWRGEAFDVRAAPDGPALAIIDRGALPVFGIAAVGVHVNGLVRGPDGPLVWVAVRARDKLLDPGKFDHIVAGGVPAGMTPFQTLLKEAAEEAGLPPELAARAVPVARIGYAMERPEGLRRDLLHCYDLELPADFQPHPADGEVERFELWPVARALAELRAGDAFKFNVAVVLIDLCLRLGLIAEPERARLRAALPLVPRRMPAGQTPDGAAAMGISRASPLPLPPG